MKKAPYKIAKTLSWVLLWGLFLLPTFASAQSFGHFVFVQQSQISSSTTLVNQSSQQNWEIQLGSGLNGTSTEAFMTASAAYSAARSPFQIIVFGNTTSAYTHDAGECIFQGPSQTSFSASGFTQLNPDGCFPGGSFAFNPSLFYDIDIAVSAETATTTDPIIYGVEPALHPTTLNGVTTNFEPQFAITGDGFQITPTASSSGVFLSGAQDFCNTAFASTTGIGATIGNGFCVAFGYLFIPTPLSLQQFQDFALSLQNKIPFAYYYDVENIFTGSNASGTQNMVSYSANLSALDFASSTGLGPILPTTPFSFLSSSTIGAYLPAGMHDLLYNLMIAGIWVEVLFLLYRKVVPTKAKI